MLIRRADCTTLIGVQLAAATAILTIVDEHCAMSLMRMMRPSREDDASIVIILASAIAIKKRRVIFVD